MNQSTFASRPASFLRHAFDWWLAQVKHVLPPTIFFFVGFNLILWTKRLILEEHGVEFSGFLTATLAALLVGKAVLVTDKIPFMRRFDGAPMIQPILFKAMRTYGAASRAARPFSRRGRRDSRFSHPPSRALLLATLFVNSGVVDGVVPCLRHDT
jgi:hypothetical protein